MVIDQVKQHAIIAVGYDYQAFYGLKLICDWLASPGRYRRFCFEADDRGVAPQSLDDVVAERPDGKYDYWQIKYTPSPNKDDNALSWDWLLEAPGKTERSRSLIKKWYDDLNQIGKDALGDVCLITNKVPDREIELSLNGKHHLDFNTAHENIKEELIR